MLNIVGLVSWVLNYIIKDVAQIVTESSLRSKIIVTNLGLVNRQVDCFVLVKDRSYCKVRS